MTMVLLCALALLFVGLATGCTEESGQSHVDSTMVPSGAPERAHASPPGSSLPGMAPATALTPSSDLSMPPARVLVWRRHEPGQLRSILESLGHEVTMATSLPDDLSAYDVIWHVGAFRAVSASERAALASFLAAGGGLHMSGERPCCDALNDAWTQLVNTVVIGGGIEIGRLGDVFAITGDYAYPYPVSQEVKAHVATMPRPVQNLELSAAGGIAGLASSANVLARGLSVDGQVVPVAAVWSSEDLVGQAGRLSIVMDVNWFEHLDAADNAAMVANLQLFLQGSRMNRCPVARARAEQEHTCVAPGEQVAVTLDGRAAWDEDGDTLTHAWYQDERLIARGATPTVELPVGEHDIALVVSDGICASAPHALRISVRPDEEPPTLSLLGQTPAIVECGQPYVDPGATAEDTCSGDLGHAIVRTGEVDTNLPGTYTVFYEVTDDAGLSAGARRDVIVEDTSPPLVETVAMIELWQPNHSYRTFSLSDCVASVHDTCDTTLDPARAGRILWVSSNEPDNGLGDGRTQGDIQILDDTTFRVRAERQGTGIGRVYEVFFAVSDASGNETTATCKLGVAHHR